MKTGLNTQAYTIVEVMIVLAVTGFLLIMVLGFISGQQGRTEFNQAINDIQAQVKDAVNNVATGYYANAGNYSCDANGSGPSISAITAQTGTNKGCIFIGRAIQFAVGGDPSSYYQYSLVGQRQTSAGKEVGSLPEAYPTAIAPGAVGLPHATVPDASEKLQLSSGLKVVTMRFVDGSNPVNSSCPSSANCIGAVAFMSSLAAYDASGSGNLSSGAQNVNLYAIPSSKLNQTSAATVDFIDSLNTTNPPPNPSGGVVICFQSSGSNQWANLTIGGSGRDISTKLDIFSGGSVCP